VKTLNWSHLEKIRQDCASKLIIIAIKFLDLALFDLVDQSLTTIIIDVVVLKLEFLKRWSLIHKADNLFSTNGSNFIISQNKSLKLLLLLIRK
jgi:hypothetical protein